MTIEQKRVSRGSDRARTLLEGIKPVFDIGEREALLEALLSRDDPISISFVNAHAINLVWNDEDIFSAFARSDVLLRDGMGTKLWMRALGLPTGLNLNGTDLIPDLFEKLNGKSVALFGTTDPYLEKVAGDLRARGMNVVALADGFQDAQFYARLMERHRPRMVVLAMGMPKQEKVARHLRDVAAYPCLIVCGGAIVDFLAGRFPRAPLILQKLGLEWAFRLALEPKRLFRRYVLGVPISFYRLAVTRFSNSYVRATHR